MIENKVMPHISFEEKLIVFKIVYFGPGMSGKTTNLLYIHSQLAGPTRGDMITIDTEGERTLFFDFFPLELGTVAGYSLKFHLYTIPGQIHYEASRRLILEGADGVVFVLDSCPELFSDNVKSFEMMQCNLADMNCDPGLFPIVLQYNKRDLYPRLPLGSLEKELGLEFPVTEAIAVEGFGVMETLRQASRGVISRFEV